MINIADVRKRAGISQSDLAERVGVTQAMLSNIENGKRQPSVKLAKKLSRELGVAWTCFYEEFNAENET